jgi:hypothetical protein
VSSGSTNDGIWIGGQATVNAGAMAAGPNATAQGSYHSAVPVPADLAELRAALESLAAELRSAPVGVGDPASLAEVAETALNETGKERPNKRILGGLLQALLAGVANVTTLANAVEAIQHAVSILL